MLANALRALSYEADGSKFEQYYNQANEIDRKYWNWRLFLFSIKALRVKMDRVLPDNRDAILEEAKELARSYAQCFPNDERAIDALAELYILENDRAEAIHILQSAIDGTEHIAPQCCVTYIDLLDPVKDAKQIISVSKKGIRDTCRDQPDASIGYFLLRQALAIDAEISAEAARNGYSKVNEQDLCETVKLYSCAYSLLQNETYRNTIESRCRILCDLGEIDAPEFKDKPFE